MDKLLLLECGKRKVKCGVSFASLQFHFCMFCKKRGTAWQSSGKTSQEHETGSAPSLAHPPLLSCGSRHMKLCFYGCLVFRALALAVLSQALQGLVDQSYILLIDSPASSKRGREKEKQCNFGKTTKQDKANFPEIQRKENLENCNYSEK